MYGEGEGVRVEKDTRVCYLALSASGGSMPGNRVVAGERKLPAKVLPHFALPTYRQKVHESQSYYIHEVSVMLSVRHQLMVQF